MVGRRNKVTSKKSTKSTKPNDANNNSFDNHESNDHPIGGGSDESKSSKRGLKFWKKQKQRPRLLVATEEKEGNHSSPPTNANEKLGEERITIPPPPRLTSVTSVSDHKNVLEGYSSPFDEDTGQTNNNGDGHSSGFQQSQTTTAQHYNSPNQNQAHDEDVDEIDNVSLNKMNENLDLIYSNLDRGLNPSQGQHQEGASTASAGARGSLFDDHHHQHEHQVDHVLSAIIRDATPISHEKLLQKPKDDIPHDRKLHCIARLHNIAKKHGVMEQAALTNAQQNHHHHKEIQQKNLEEQLSQIQSSSSNTMRDNIEETTKKTKKRLKVDRKLMDAVLGVAPCAPLGKNRSTTTDNSGESGKSQISSPTSVMSDISNRLAPSINETSQKIASFKTSLQNAFNCTSTSLSDLIADEIKDDICFCADDLNSDGHGDGDFDGDREIYKRYMLMKKRTGRSQSTAKYDSDLESGNGTYAGRILTVSNKHRMKDAPTTPSHSRGMDTPTTQFSPLYASRKRSEKTEFTESGFSSFYTASQSQKLDTTEEEEQFPSFYTAKERSDKIDDRLNYLLDESGTSIDSLDNMMRHLDLEAAKLGKTTTNGPYTSKQPESEYQYPYGERSPEQSRAPNHASHYESYSRVPSIKMAPSLDEASF